MSNPAWAEKQVELFKEKGLNITCWVNGRKLYCELPMKCCDQYVLDIPQECPIDLVSFHEQASALMSSYKSSKEVQEYVCTDNTHSLHVCHCLSKSEQEVFLKHLDLLYKVCCIKAELIVEWNNSLDTVIQISGPRSKVIETLQEAITHYANLTSYKLETSEGLLIFEPKRYSPQMLKGIIAVMLS